MKTLNTSPAGSATLNGVVGRRPAHLNLRYTRPSRPMAPRNRLLAALSGDTESRILPSLEPVSLSLGAVVYEAGNTERYVYFPNDSIVSLQYIIENGKAAEIAVVGNEGIVGLASVMGGSHPCSRAVVQAAGSAYRLPCRLLREEFNRNSELRWLVLRYTQSMIIQMSQAAVCNRHHTIEQQVCRRLLLSLDRQTSNELIMTQGMIARMLGVRREGVTAAAGKLRKMGVIEYRRGRITVRDRDELERLSCECYEVVKTECDRLLPHGAAQQHAAH
jgi:CRP-like cAMP-binding protein